MQAFRTHEPGALQDWCQDIAVRSERRLRRVLVSLGAPHRRLGNHNRCGSLKAHHMLREQGPVSAIGHAQVSYEQQFERWIVSAEASSPPQGDLGDAILRVNRDDQAVECNNMLLFG